MTAPLRRFEPPTLPPLPVRASRPRRIAALLRNPISMYTEEHFTKPLLSAPFGGQTFAQVMDPEIVQQVLQGDGTDFGRSIFVQRLLAPALREGLLTTEGQKWRRQRRAASPAFRQKALDALVPSFATAGQAMAKRLTAQAGTITNIHPEMVRATFDVIIDTLLQGSANPFPLDKTAKDVDLFLNTIARLSLPDVFPILDRVAPRQFFIPGYRRGMAAIGRLRALAEEIVQRRIAVEDDREDLMGQLIRARDPETGNRLSPTELVDNALTFVGAGHETTALALTWTLYSLGHSPQLQDALAEEANAVLSDRDVTPADIPSLALHERVIKEAMRLFPPVPIIGRKVLNPVTLGGQDFAPGDNLAIAIYAMHRHHSLWDAPGLFDADRFLPEAEKARHRFAYLPFGGGPRICIGLRFALMEAVTMLTYISRNLIICLPKGHRAEPHLTITMRPKNGMHLGVRRRS
ncbi:MAG: cytochrome P450 [Parvularcula sp.]